MTGVLTAVIDPEIHQRAKARAAETGVKLWQLVEGALRRELLRTGPPPTAPVPTTRGRIFIGGQVDPALVTWTRHQAAEERITIWQILDRALRFERLRVEGIALPAPTSERVIDLADVMAAVEL